MVWFFWLCFLIGISEVATMLVFQKLAFLKSRSNILEQEHLDLSEILIFIERDVWVWFIGVWTWLNQVLNQVVNVIREEVLGRIVHSSIFY
jgi:hypothetical protein